MIAIKGGKSNINICIRVDGGASVYIHKNEQQKLDEISKLINYSLTLAGEKTKTVSRS